MGRSHRRCGQAEQTEALRNNAPLASLANKAEAKIFLEVPYKLYFLKAIQTIGYKVIKLLFMMYF